MTITFEQIRERVAAHYSQTEPAIVLTPRGEATATIRRLRRAVPALDAAGRAEARAQLAALVVELTA